LAKETYNATAGWESVKTNLKEVEGKKYFKHLQNYLKEFIYSLL